MARLADYVFGRGDWYVTSPYGKRKHPITGKQTFHYGTDYGTNVEKWPQCAIEEGYVLLVGNTGGYGKHLWVRYPRIGKALFHAHLSAINVKQGEKVKKGTILGYTGTTGNSTGIHLHLGMQPIGKNTWENPHEYDYRPETEKPKPQEAPNTEVEAEENATQYSFSYEAEKSRYHRIHLKEGETLTVVKDDSQVLTYKAGEDRIYRIKLFKGEKILIT